MREPGEVADLGDQPERRDGRDSAEAGQDLHLGAPPLAAGDLGQARVKRVQLPFDPGDVDQQLLKRFLGERIVKALAREPRAVQLRPRCLPLAEDPSVAQQLLQHPVAGRQPHAAQIITRPEQITEPLKLRRRQVHEPQHPGAIQANELLRVSSVGLHTITGANRDQRQRDDITRDPQLRQSRHSANPPGPAS